MASFGILVFGFNRALYLAEVLESLKKQNALPSTHVWLDGHQGSPRLRSRTELAFETVSRYPVAEIHRHHGNLGFRKLILQALSDAVERFDEFLVLEDDCFPTSDAVEVFQRELAEIRTRPDVFSIYGHPFLVKAERPVCTRFQGWGWASTADKMRPILKELIDCYSVPETDYLAFVKQMMTPDVKARLDVTPPRQPSHTLEKFFAWDETIALLTALRGWTHKPTSKRTIYNFGVGGDGAHFEDIEWFRKPPYNMVLREELWEHF